MTTQKPRRAGRGAWTLALVAALLCACGSGPKSPSSSIEGVSLSRAIREAAAHVEERLPPGTKLALLNFNAPTEAFSRYVLDELAAVFVTNGRLVIVDRTDIDLIRTETQFQLSGEVSDESAQSIGEMLGAQSILSGSLTELGGVYRFMVKVLNVETAHVEVLFPLDLLPDSRAEALLGAATPARTASSQTVPSQTVPSQTAPSQTAAPQTATPQTAASQTAPSQTAAPQTAAPQTVAPQTAQQQSTAQQQPAAAPVENYPPELDRRLAELAALPATTDAAVLIEQRNAWAALLQYVETHFREHPEFAVAYDPAIVQDNINYNRGTVTAKVAIQTTPLSGYQKAVTTVKTALEKTGKSSQWGWESWPGGSSFFVNNTDIFFDLYAATIIDKSNRIRQYARNNFLTGEIYANSAHGGPRFYGKRIRTRVVLLKADGEVIVVNNQQLCYVTGYSERGFVFAPAPLPVWFVFSDVKASDLSGGATFKIISIDNVALDSKDDDYVRITTETINGK
jgi:hypothetical protein